MGFLLVLARAVDDLAGGDLLQVLPVDRLAVGLGGLLQLGGGDPAVLPRDRLGHGYRQIPGALHLMNLDGQAARLEVHAGDGVAELGLSGLLLDEYGLPLRIEPHDTEAPEDRHVVRSGDCQDARQYENG